MTASKILTRCTECFNTVSLQQQSQGKWLCVPCQVRTDAMAKAGERTNNEALAKDALLKRTAALEADMAELRKRVDCMVNNLNNHRPEWEQSE